VGVGSEVVVPFGAHFELDTVFELVVGAVGDRAGDA